MPVETAFGTRPDSQMTLQDRKLVVARLMRMVAFPRDSLSNGSLSQDDLDEVLGQFDRQIGRDWRRQDEMDSVSRLDQFLARIHDKTATAIGLIADGADDILVRAASFIDNCKCSDCGGKPTACKGLASDILHFHDSPPNEGGRCLLLIRRLVDYFAECTERYLSECCGSLHFRSLPEKIEIDIVPRRDGDRLLPLDGAIEFIPACAISGRRSEKAVLTLRLPVGDDSMTGTDFEHLDYALLSLAYAVFHEVFVHGSQGRAGEPVPKVEPSCAFTEGAVDTVAFHLLFDEILADNSGFPEEVRPLVEAFRRQAKRFHDLRFDWSQASPSQPTRRSPIDDGALRQRNFGRERIYQPLIDIERKFQKPAGWAKRCLIQLNLSLSVDQRNAMAELADFWSPSNTKMRTPIQTELCRIVDSFLETGDHNKFISRINKITG